MDDISVNRMTNLNLTEDEIEQIKALLDSDEARYLIDEINTKINEVFDSLDKLTEKVEMTLTERHRRGRLFVIGQFIEYISALITERYGINVLYMMEMEV